MPDIKEWMKIHEERVSSFFFFVPYGRMTKNGGAL